MRISLFIRTKFASFFAALFIIASRRPFNSAAVAEAIFTSLAFFFAEAMREKKRNNMWRFYKLFSSFSSNLVKLTRGVYQTHNLKFRAFCRLWLAGKTRNRYENEIYFS